MSLPKWHSSSFLRQIRWSCCFYSFYQSLFCHPLLVFRTNKIGTSINANTLNANWEIICLALDPLLIIHPIYLFEHNISTSIYMYRILNHKFCFIFRSQSRISNRSNVCLFTVEFDQYLFELRVSTSTSTQRQWQWDNDKKSILIDINWISLSIVETYSAEMVWSLKQCNSIKWKQIDFIEENEIKSRWQKEIRWAWTKIIRKK